MGLEKITQKLQEALQSAQSIASKSAHSELKSAHVLLALLQQEGGITVPIRIKGPAGRPDWHLEPAAALPAAMASAGRKVIQQLPKLIPAPRAKPAAKAPSAAAPAAGNPE